MEEQKIISVTPETLLDEAAKMKYEDYRLVQICSVNVQDGYELTYSFGKEYDLVHLRMTIQKGTKISSISHIFYPAFFYENEIHDLFGVPVEFMTLDFKGNLYRTAQKTPFQ